uniref:Putative WRKY1 n=1 Tax=Davidia involucrata TaxID=16924 RepID=A0A5B7AUQ8_DAVIN
MERPKEGTKLENSIRSSSPLTGMLDYLCIEGEKSSLGFMELLGFQDFSSPSIFDILPAAHASMSTTSAVPASTSEIFKYQPMTPNSSSISSESSDAPNDHEPTIPVHDDEEEEEQPKNNNNKQLKPKKTSQKRQREPKFAFMTKSQVDHLEDGYRWRKYGQKAVKNSPFPRSYYRCTNATCNVKKRVERSFNDPSIVVTTYEGKHTHPSPLLMPRAGAGAGLRPPPPSSGFPQYDHHQTHYFNNLLMSPLNCCYLGPTNPTAASVHERRFCTTTTTTTPSSPALLRDHGLLQDIVPSLMMMRNEE